MGHFLSFSVLMLFIAAARNIKASIVERSGSSVCYAPYGCFTTAPPFDFSLVPLPQPPWEIGTRFLLYTRTFTEHEELSDTSIEILEKSRFNPEIPTKIVIHGFAATDSETSIIDVKGWWGLKMKDELLYKEHQNVIIVDWIKGAKFPYHRSVGNTRLIGAQVAYFIMTMKTLVKRTGTRHGPIHIIGFSLGAHIAGFVGRRLRDKGEFLHRITGLDPATVKFKNAHIDVRLDPSDARFVDVIHTSYVLGITAPQGHMDFYPNGGRFQEGCSILDGPSGVVCHHVRSALFFTESINAPFKSACPWRSYRCDSKDDFDRGRCLNCDLGCPRMGYDANRNENIERGKFFLYTASQPLFCVYHYLVTIHTSNTLFSGINAHIYIVLTGTKGTSGTVKLVQRDISRGSVETFVAKSPKDLGDLRGISVWHLHYAELWKVDKIKVRPGWNYFTYSACFHMWIHYNDRTSKNLNVGNLSC